MVPRRVTYVIKIVVFTTGSYTTLATCRPGITAVFSESEGVLELNHACIGKKQGRVIARYQGRRLDDRMTLTFKETQKSAT